MAAAGTTPQAVAMVCRGGNVRSKRQLESSLYGGGREKYLKAGIVGPSVVGNAFVYYSLFCGEIRAKSYD